MPEQMDRRLRQLQLQTRYPVEHLLAGEYRSVFKGRGMDFDEIRPYEKGDDVRTIDWNVTARTGKPHIKRYIEERELAVWFLVDTSASCRTGHGERTKWDAMHEITALLTLSAIRNNDRVGLILFSDRIEHINPPRKGRSHAMHLLSDLLHAEPQGKQTNLQPALDALAHLARRRSLAFLLSDFLFDVNRDRLGQTGFRQDLIAVAVNDSQEIEPPVCGLAAVKDSETGEQMLCDFNRTHQASYRRAFDTRRAALRTELNAINADLIELTTESDCAETLTRFFRNRLRRAADETGG
ncbi:DUF58 domain-containing protein [Tichowtungia aerotolerans]|uniref:DUF58 domain-containing protein n=1 Tax=Tichowtungia aerotolerans TaxID=2697043 RepID=A0A6P1MAL5_9BACT|nr:DUF58 domain-containing protein [Tichowtungia aerotolerans]QHI68606.1 DUF58 domain-containing protein [Tichowtungia aerotolerans]